MDWEHTDLYNIFNFGLYSLSIIFFGLYVLFVILITQFIIHWNNVIGSYFTDHILFILSSIFSERADNDEY